jgi:hypothetical protein
VGGKQGEMGAYKSRPASVCAGIVDKRSRKAYACDIVFDR